MLWHADGLGVWALVDVCHIWGFGLSCLSARVTLEQ